jgi:hypothetical protein
MRITLTAAGFTLALLLSFSSFTLAQSSEAGLFLGVATYKGDLQNHLFSTKFIKPAVGILYRRNLNSHWGYRLGITYGAVTADDAESDDEYQVRRNLSFRSRIWDFHGMFEFNFFSYQLASDRSARWTPFLMGGLSVYHFNPQANWMVNGMICSLLVQKAKGQMPIPAVKNTSVHR